MARGGLDNQAVKRPRQLNFSSQRKFHTSSLSAYNMGDQSTALFQKKIDRNIRRITVIFLAGKPFDSFTIQLNIDIFVLDQHKSVISLESVYHSRGCIGLETYLNGHLDQLD